MKTQFKIIILTCVATLLTSCNIAGYDFQENAIYIKSTKDTQTNKTVMEFMQSRTDLFSSMLLAIEYTGLDTLYTKTGNTYLLLTNYALSSLIKENAAYNPNNAAVYYNTSAYFYVNKVPNPDLPGTTMFGTKWTDYDVNTVRELLKYHVVKGTYNYTQLNANRVWADTYAAGDTCKMSFVLTNDRNASLNIQTNSIIGGVVSQIKPRTSGLECTNSGSVQVMDRYILPPTKKQLNLNY